jgi:hypothetical protein
MASAKPNSSALVAGLASCVLLLGGGFAQQSRATGQTQAPSPAFYLPENPSYPILTSACDSVRFTIEKTLQRDERGHLVSISSFVDPEARIMGWHDFGHLEGPGWAANAAGGAWEIYELGSRLHRAGWQAKAVSIMDHILETGFLDRQTGFIRGYRDTITGQFCLNYKHRSDWFCPGSMAKAGFQLLQCSEALGDTPRAREFRTAAVRCAEWIQKHVASVPNGWFPRRVSPDGQVYTKTPEGGPDPFWQTSADGLFILQLQATLSQRGGAEYRTALRDRTAVFMKAGGIFGSINHDTYDPNENVAYSVAFRTLLLVSRVLQDESIRQFAYAKCLAGLEPFQMTGDRNGVATKGLLFMEKSWDTAYLWENAEAALAYFEAALDLRQIDPAKSLGYERDGLTILRAIAKHHYGSYGFLTEGVDWNNHVGQQHHINQAQFGAIRYTEPFLNNQHIVEPTLFYLEHLARVSPVPGSPAHRCWTDLEGNRIWEE